MTRGRQLALLGLGAALLVVSAAIGGEGSLLDAIVSPPPIIRAALVAILVVLGLSLGRASLERFQAAGALDGLRPHGAAAARRSPLADADPVTMLRGIRLAFLAMAAFAAAASWLLGHPLPLVLAIVIAAVDILETSFMLLVASVRGR